MHVRVDRLGGFGVFEMRVPLSFGMNVSEKHEAQAHAREKEQNVRDDAPSRALRAHYFRKETAKRDKEEGRGRGGEDVGKVGRVRKKKAASRTARKGRRRGNEKDRDRAAARPPERLDECHGPRLLRNFMKEHRSCGKPPERAAHLEGPRHDDPVDKAVKRTAEKKREGFHPAVVSMGAMSAVRGMTAPGVKKPFKENEKDNDRQGTLPHPFGISPRREGFGEKMPERNAQQQPAGERHEGVPEAAAPPEGEPGRSGERQKARQQIGRKDFKHARASEKERKPLYGDPGTFCFSNRSPTSLFSDGGVRMRSPARHKNVMRDESFVTQPSHDCQGLVTRLP